MSVQGVMVVTNDVTICICRKCRIVCALGYIGLVAIIIIITFNFLLIEVIAFVAARRCNFALAIESGADDRIIFCACQIHLHRLAACVRNRSIQICGAIQTYASAGCPVTAATGCGF